MGNSLEPQSQKPSASTKTPKNINPHPNNNNKTQPTLLTRQQFNQLSKKFLKISTRQSMIVQPHSDDEGKDGWKNKNKKQVNSRYKNKNKNKTVNVFKKMVEQSKQQQYLRFHISTLTQNTQYPPNNLDIHLDEHQVQDITNNLNKGVGVYNKNKQQHKLPNQPLVQVQEQVQIQQHIMSRINNKIDRDDQQYKYKLSSQEKVTKPCSGILSPSPQILPYVSPSIELSMNQIIYRHSNNSQRQRQKQKQNQKQRQRYHIHTNTNTKRDHQQQQQQQQQQTQNYKQQLHYLKCYKQAYTQIIHLMHNMLIYRYDNDFVGEVLSICNTHYHALYNTIHYNDHQYDSNTNNKDDNDKQYISKYNISLSKLSQININNNNNNTNTDHNNNINNNNTTTALSIFQQFTHVFILFISRINKKANSQFHTIRTKQQNKYQLILADKDRVIRQLQQYKQYKQLQYTKQLKQSQQYQRIAIDLYTDLQLQKSLFKSYKANAEKSRQGLGIRVRQLERQLAQAISKNNKNMDMGMNNKMDMNMNNKMDVRMDMQQSNRLDKNTLTKQNINKTTVDDNNIIQQYHQANKMNYRLLDKHIKLSLQ